MLRAMEQIRRMRGGAQSHLMRCSDGNYYVVKFQNNPQHPRVLVNEMLGTRLASRLGLPTTPAAVIEVSEELIQLTPDLCIEMPRQRIPCKPGKQFGSRYPGDPSRLTLLDFLPDPQLERVENLHEFAGILVFDKWTCNTNGKQTLFQRETREGPDSPYQAIMIAQGFALTPASEIFPTPLARTIHLRHETRRFSGLNAAHMRNTKRKGPALRTGLFPYFNSKIITSRLITYDGYIRGSDQFSSVSFTLCRNWWATAPSTTRWS